MGVSGDTILSSAESISSIKYEVWSTPVYFCQSLDSSSLCLTSVLVDLMHIKGTVSCTTLAIMLVMIVTGEKS